MSRPNPSIVVAGDVSFLRSLVRIALEDDGMHVVAECSDQMELIGLIRMHHPDVVIVDLGLDEYEMVRLIEKILDVDSGTAIVAITEGRFGASERLLAAGARAYLVKPFSMYDLTDIVRKVAPVFRVE